MFKDWVMHKSKQFTNGDIHEVTDESLLNVTGVQFTNLNRNLTQFMPSEIHFKPDLTERYGSLDM